MALDADVLALLRVWVGSAPADATERAVQEADFEARYDRLASVEAVALEVLRQRRADILADPAKGSIDGDASWDWQANIERLDGDIARLERIVETPGSTLQVGRIVRTRATR